MFPTDLGGWQFGTTVDGWCVGPDGALWLTVDYYAPGGGPRHSELERFSLDGRRKLVAFRRSSVLAADIFPGPDGHLWLSDGYRLGARGRLTRVAATGVGMVPGADGFRWGLNGRTSEIKRLSPGGRIDTFAYPFTFPDYGSDATSAMAPGPDGNVWFVDSVDEYGSAVDDVLGKVDKTGQIETYPLPDGTDPQSITAGPDGRMWVPVDNDAGTPYILRFTPQPSAAGWPAAAQPRIASFGIDGGGFRVRLGCRGTPGLYCDGTLALLVRAGAADTRKLVRKVTIAAGSSGVVLLLKPRHLRDVAGRRVTVAITFTTSDFLGRHGRANLARRLLIG